MPKSPASWVVIWIDTKGKPVLDYVIVSDKPSLEARVLSLTSQAIEYTVVDEHGKIVEVTIDTSPRISFGTTAAPTPKKPRAKRRSKSEMLAAAALKTKPAPVVTGNGQVHS